ncbi:hypothetical protein [Flavobacterium sp.]|uniref:hypothetical protein n=1 Tax=Flavobacterium sp. TaxID=239 RepID=UPI0037512028
MKKIVAILLIFVFYSCGGEYSVPFEYQDNSRIILEGKLVDNLGNALPNQSAEIFTFKSSTRITVIEVFSNNEGAIFISVPKSNYKYSLGFSYKQIISITKHPELMIEDTNNPGTFFGFTSNLTSDYYDLGTIKLANFN